MLREPLAEKDNLKENLELLIKQCLFTIEEYKTIIRADVNALRGLEKTYFGFLKMSYFLIGVCELVIKEKAINSNKQKKKKERMIRHIKELEELLDKYNNKTPRVYFRDAGERTGLRERRIQDLTKEILRKRNNTVISK
jgi:hypothetical protein